MTKIDPVAQADAQVERLDAELSEARETLATLETGVRTAAAEAAQLDERRHQPNAGDAGERARELRERISTELNPARTAQRRRVAKLTEQLRDARTRRERLTPPDVEPLADAVAAAQASLQPLLSEQAAMVGRIDEAIVAGDTDQVIALRLRAGELPARIDGARMALLGAQHVHAEAMSASFGPALVDAGDELADAEQGLGDAQARVDQAEAHRRNVAGNADQWRQRATRHRRDLERLTAAQRASVVA